MLYYAGSLECLERPMVALVGTRRSSAYGREMARMLTRGLCDAGVCVCLLYTSLVMGATCVLYGVLAFTNLGSTVAPQTGWVSTSPRSKTICSSGEVETHPVCGATVLPRFVKASTP